MVNALAMTGCLEPCLHVPNQHLCRRACGDGIRKKMGTVGRIVTHIYAVWPGRRWAVTWLGDMRELVGDISDSAVATRRQPLQRHCQRGRRLRQHPLTPTQADVPDATN